MYSRYTGTGEWYVRMLLCDVAGVVGVPRERTVWYINS